MELGLNMKRSKATKRITMARPRPKFTERFLNLSNYYRETQARYHNAKSQPERKHLLVVLKETAQHARHLASIRKYLHLDGSKLNFPEN